jgi:outer membrane protein assembly factor BamB
VPGPSPETTDPAQGVRVGPVAALMLVLALARCGAGQMQGSAAHPTATPAPHVALDAGLAQDTVYAVASTGVSTSYPGFLLALNARTGAVRWKHATAGLAGTPAVAGGELYIAPQDGTIYGLDAATGAIRWTFHRSVRVGDRIDDDGYPTLAGQTLVVGSDGGVVYALDAATGKPLWQRTVDSGGDSAPAIRDGAVSMTTVNGTVSALRASDGALNWSYHASGTMIASPVVAP